MHDVVPDPGLVWPAAGRHQPCFELAAGAHCQHLHAAASVMPAFEPSAAASERLQCQSNKMYLISLQLQTVKLLLMTATAQTVHVRCCEMFSNVVNHVLTDRHLPV